MMQKTVMRWKFLRNLVAKVLRVTSESINSERMCY